MSASRCKCFTCQPITAIGSSEQAAASAGSDGTRLLLLYAPVHLRGCAESKVSLKVLGCMQGVRVNSVNPGTVNTSIFTTSGMTPEQAEAYKAKSALANPLGRVGEPEDAAKLCYFLTDNAKSGWLTGQCIYLDGGKLLPL